MSECVHCFHTNYATKKNNVLQMQRGVNLSELTEFVLKWLGNFCLIGMGYCLRMIHEENNKGKKK